MKKLQKEYLHYYGTEYLGDGVYVADVGMYFKLMANDHLNPTDTIYLEKQVLKNLIEFVKTHSSWLNED
jgi:hypothetical protein